uniref:Dolichol kinase n=1 Tax=Craspedostauros australis TaxID=1486917 RepID=A0A7R9WVP3_9STRA
MMVQVNEGPRRRSHSTTQLHDSSSSSSTTTSSTRSKLALLKIFAGGISITALFAKLGVLGTPYTNQMIGQDILAALFCATGAYVVTQLVSVAHNRHGLSSIIARKLIHTLTGPLFTMSWVLFSTNDVGARVFAGLVTMINAYKLYKQATDTDDGGNDISLAKAVSRSGDVKEALGGPFIYIGVLQFLIWAFWRDSMAAVVSICTMCVGDGLADLVGRKYGKNNAWFFASKDNRKSMVGTLAFAVGSFVASVGIIQLFAATGCVTAGVAVTAIWDKLLLICVACSIVELIPFGDDNYTVPIAALILGKLLLPS